MSEHPVTDAEGAAIGRPHPNEGSISPSIESLRLLQRVVVIDVLDNLQLRDAAYINDLVSRYTKNLTGVNPDTDPENFSDFFDIVEEAPRNSILGVLIDLGRGRWDNRIHVFHPLFSSHLSLPCKPGEQVWALYEDPFDLTGQGYWVSRITGPVDVEDANYTHYDRLGAPLTPEQAQKFLEDDKKTPKATNPGFPNGPVHTDTDSSAGDKYTLKALNEFETIVRESKEAQDFTIEPVPRFTKRPGDMVLQGSHNATIVLGTDRGYQSTEDEIKTELSNAHIGNALSPGHGAIDIVTGRGRFLDKEGNPLKSEELKSLAGKGEVDSPWERIAPGDKSKVKLVKPPGGKPTRTEPQVIMNARASFETDKNLSVLNDELSNASSNASEGDPDFLNDAARVYLTMTSNAEHDFNLSYPDFAAPQASMPPAAHVVTKADEIRIIARKNKKPGINGSIRIVKEGEIGDDQCVITLLADGTVAIDAKKIIIGDGRDGQTFLGNEATEPVVLGDKLVKAFKDFAEKSTIALTDPGRGAKGNMGAPLVIPLWSHSVNDLVAAVEEALSAHAKVK